VIPQDEALGDLQEDDSNEASEAAPSSTISLSTADTPWAHIANTGSEQGDCRVHSVGSSGL